MTYEYSSYTVAPNLDTLETAILGSAFSESYDHLRWDKSDEKLKVYMDSELSTENKATLDTLVEEDA